MPWLIIPSFLLLGIIVLQIRFHRRLSRQRQAMILQSQEIQKQLRELEQNNRALQELNSEKQQIIGVVSHDLKGPFNRIFALSQLMSMTGDNLRADQKEYLGKIHQIVADGLSMVRNLLDNRRLEDRGIELNPEPLNITAVVVNLVKQYQSLAEKKQIRINFNQTEAIPAKADKIYLSRVFENLLSNAIKFSPAGKQIHVTISDEGTSVEVSVKDEGPGILAEDQKKLFQKFQKLAARPTAGESSTGLGLFIVKTFIEKMGGTIRCESEEGKGAKFTVSIKREDQLKR